MKTKTTKTTKTGFRIWLGAGALAGLLILGAPLPEAEAQETRQDTSAVRQDTSSQTAAAYRADRLDPVGPADGQGGRGPESGRV
jgi:hypothetical protein